MTKEDQEAIKYLLTLIDLIQKGYITVSNGLYSITESGKEYADTLTEKFKNLMNNSDIKTKDSKSINITIPIDMKKD